MKAKLYRNKEFNVDVFSDEDINGNPITPLITQNVLVKSKPIAQSSSWEAPSSFSSLLYAEINLSRGNRYYAFNPAVSNIKYEIDNSLLPFQPLSQRYNEESSILNVIDNDYRILDAQDNLRNIKIDVSALDFHLDSSGDGYIECKFELRYGSDFYTADKVTFFQEVVNGTSYTNKTSFTHTIDYLNRGDKIWLYFYLRVRVSQTGGGITFGNLTANSMNVDITATRVTYNTIVPSIRLYDGVSQVVKSISGLTTSFPFAQAGGEMYNQRIFSGNLLRTLTGRAFNISFKDIEEWLPEINGDYQVNDDGSVYFGRYADFYKNTEIGVFTDVRFDTYKKTFNPRFAINQFTYKYKKYASQKEKEIENTFDIAHGETQWRLMNDEVENKKEVDVNFVRDSFYLDEQRRKAFDLNANTSTQDDDTIFILDTKELENDLEFTETDFLRHTYDEETGYLKLTNTGNFNFQLLGIAVGETFKILDDVNAGTYTLIEVTDRYIVINNGSGSIANNGERTTQFTYIVSTTTAPFISWSNEGFSYIDGITDTENFANLRYTIKRNIVRFYNQYLATCNLFAKKAIKNTSYKNNGTLALNYEGLQTVENEAFTPTTPLLSPYKHEIKLIMDFNTFMQLQSKARNEKGYIRFIDANMHVVKGFIQEATFKNTDKNGEMTAIIEEKYEQSTVNIVYSGESYIIINDEYRVHKLRYEVDGEKIKLKDEHGLLLYNPIYWHKIAVNSAISTTKEELLGKLKLLE